MNINLVNRRIHLYLAMFLLPWFFIYGVSSIAFSHGAYFAEIYKDGIPQWTERFDRPYDRPIPEGADDRQIGAQIIKDVGLEGAYGTYRPGKNRLNIYLFDFWSATRLTYFIDGKRLLAEDRRFRWDHFLTGLHARGGFQQDAFLNDAWGVLVDIVQIAILVWIVSGIYMWWLLPQTRLWGAAALGGGIVSFLIFLLAL